MIPSYPPATTYTGPPASLHRLCRELRAIGVDVRVATTNDNGPTTLQVTADSWVQHEGVPVFYGSRQGGRGDLSPRLHRCIQREARLADLVHVAPIFSWPTLSSARACRAAGKPLVVSPRGSLAPQALQWRYWKKVLFMALGGRMSMRQVTAFHATTPREATDIGTRFPTTPISVVPNGVHVPTDADIVRWSGEGSQRMVLYLGRLHPHKNIDVLMSSWARIAPHFPDGVLVLAGAGEGHMTSELQRLAMKLGIAAQVEFAGFVQGEEKARLLTRARVLVLPSKSENFGNAVAEALAHGTPVIASIGTPWEDLGVRGCGWWVDGAEVPLSDALHVALSREDAEIRRMGLAGRRWMSRDFGWPAVAARMRDFYGEVLERTAAIH